MKQLQHTVQVLGRVCLGWAPVVQQDVGPPDLTVGESDVGHAGKVGCVPLQVEICPVLQTHTTHTHVNADIHTDTDTKTKKICFPSLTNTLLTVCEEKMKHSTHISMTLSQTLSYKLHF